MEEYITVEEAAELLKVHPRQVKKMIVSGKLRAKNINATGNQRKYWRVLKIDVIKPDKLQSQV